MQKTAAPELGPLISETIAVKAKQFGIPEALLRAMVWVESGGNLFAMRYEPFYAYLWDAAQGRPFRKLSAGEVNSALPPKGFLAQPGLTLSRATEWMGQKSSWGPMQVMGAVARELGFNGYFTELCAPLGVYYGCKHLQRLADRFLAPHGWKGVAAAYNAGTPRRNSEGRWVNQGYLDKLVEAGCDFRLL
jgi:soluble lytic murein transglycosylase-like protein